MFQSYQQQGQTKEQKLLLKQGSAVVLSLIAGAAAFVHCQSEVDLVNQQDLSGQTLLIKACYEGDSEAVISLLEKGAIIDTVDSLQNNAFHLTTHFFCNKTPKILDSMLGALEQPKNNAHQKEAATVVNQLNRFGKTPLMYLCRAVIRKGDEAAFQEALDLLLSKSDPSIKDHNQSNAAFYLLVNSSAAMDTELDEALQKLLVAGCDLQARDKQGRNLIDYVVLHESDRAKAMAKLQILIKLGVPPTFRYYLFLHGHGLLKVLRKVLG